MRFFLFKIVIVNRYSMFNLDVSGKLSLFISITSWPIVDLNTLVNWLNISVSMSSLSMNWVTGVMWFGMTLCLRKKRRVVDFEC